MNNESLEQTDREIEKTVKQAFSNKQVPDRLLARIVQSIETRQQANAIALIRHRFVGSPMRIAAVVLLVLTTVVLISLTSRTAHDGFLTATLIGEHTAFVAAGNNLDINSSDNLVLRRWFSQQLDTSLPPAAPLAANLILAGGRLCQLNGKRVASYAYQIEEKTISLYVIETKATLNFDLATTEESENLHIDSLDNSSYATWNNQGWQYFLVTNFPIEDFAKISASLSSNSRQQGQI